MESTHESCFAVKCGCRDVLRTDLLLTRPRIFLATPKYSAATESATSWSRSQGPKPESMALRATLVFGRHETRRMCSLGLLQVSARLLDLLSALQMDRSCVPFPNPFGTWPPGPRCGLDCGRLSASCNGLASPHLPSFCEHVLGCCIVVFVANAVPCRNVAGC